MNPPLARGAVVLVRFDPTEGREIRKTRPAVVVSNHVACRHDAVVQVVPITSLPDRELRPYESRCSSRSSGLAHPSRAVANQIRTVSRGRTGRLLGRLTPDETMALDRALLIQLGLGARQESEAPPLEPVPDGSQAPKPKESPVREGFGAENGTEIANLTAPGAVRSRI